MDAFNKPCIEPAFTSENTIASTDVYITKGVQVYTQHMIDIRRVWTVGDWRSVAEWTVESDSGGVGGRAVGANCR